ncbi:MAG TPA: heme o synthase [Bdellovibrionota bacterium]|jgi:protoheme IX farnesyltransferase
MTRNKISAYFSLTKPTIVLLFVVTGFAAIVAEGSLLGQPGKMALVLLAMAMTAGSANALNMYFDRDIDSLMERTKRRRPIPLHKVSPQNAALFGLIIGSIAIGFYLWATNWVAAFWSFFTIAFYVGIYTLWLKRRTPYNIVIGGAAGATAPLIGWAAASGHVSPLAWVLFLVVFLWTPPHFWALAIAIQDEYKAAKVPMLPVTHGERRTRIEILLYTILLLPVTIAPYFLGSSGIFYLICASALGVFYLWKTVQLLGRETREDSKKLFWISILYLFLLFIALFVDVIFG